MLLHFLERSHWKILGYLRWFAPSGGSRILRVPSGYDALSAVCASSFLRRRGVWQKPSVCAIRSALSSVVSSHFLLLPRSGFAWVASIEYGFSATFWFQALIIEVCSLTVFIFLVCWWSIQIFVKTISVTYFYLLRLLYGLALYNH